MATQARTPTYAPLRRWSSAEAVRAQGDVTRNPFVLPVVFQPPGPYLSRSPTYAPIRQWSSAEAIRAQIYPNLVGQVLTAPIARNFDYSVQPWNKLSSTAIRALPDNYTNLIIHTPPSPQVQAFDYSVQPWNGRVSRAAINSWADNYVNRLETLLISAAPPIPRNYDYSVQPQNKLSSEAIRAWSDNFVNRVVILPEPAPLPPVDYDWPVYPPATRVSSVAVRAWADNYVNRLASGFLPFVLGPAKPIDKLPVPSAPITMDASGMPGLLMDPVWYRFFNSMSRRITLLENKEQ